MRIDIQGVTKNFGSVPALRGIDLSVYDGELVALLGPSGSGKTTLLRTIAGLEFPASGKILFQDRDVADVPVQKRGVGFVFQHYALFRHMRIWENVAFGLKVRPFFQRPSARERRRIAYELLNLVQLSGLEDRFPSQLSGGQRQRVALARALAINPAALLLDEPFGALDAKVRRELRRWLRDLHDTTGHTTLFVTHDQEEALELADRVVIMRDGLIEQIGTPEDIFLNPATAFVYGFLGDVNILDVHVSGGSVFCDGLDNPLINGVCRSGGPARLIIRPTDIRIYPDQVEGACPALVLAHRRRLDSIRLEVRLGQVSPTLEVALTDAYCQRRADVGTTIWLSFGNHGLFDPETGNK